MQTKKNTKTLKTILINFVLYGLLCMIILIPNTESSTRSYTFRFNRDDADSSKCNRMYAYFPTDYLSGSYNIGPLGGYNSTRVGGNLKVYPYRITFNYSVHWDGSLPSNSVNPWFRISRCDLSGNVIGQIDYYSGAQGSGISSKSVTLEPYQGIFVEMNCGEWWHSVWLVGSETHGYIGNFSINYNIDDAKPSAPTGFGIQDSQQYNNNGMIYTKTNPLSFKWNRGVDQGNPVSGVDGYYLYYGSDSQWIDEPQTVFSDNKGWFSNEGKYTVQLRVKDKAGLLSDPASLTFIVDRSVNQVTLPDTPLKLSANKDGTYNLDFTWNTLQDVSGIQKYQIALTDLPNAPSDGWNDAENQNYYSFTNQQVSNLPKYIYIRAIDNVGNTGECTKFGPFKIWSPPSTIQADATANELSGAPVYKVELIFQDVDAAQYVIEREGDPVIDPIVLTYQQLQQNGFRYVDTDNLRKHTQYIYSVYTVSDLGVKSEKSSTSIIIPNIKPTGIQTVVKTGSNQPIDRQYTDTNNLTFDISPQQDLEGDALYYQLRYRNLDSGESGSLPNDTYQTTPVSISDLNLSDGQYEFWLNIRELYNTILAPEVTESLHRIIYIDSKPPSTPVVTISPSERTNQTQPVLSFLATDETSGIDHYEISIDGQDYVAVENPYTLPSQASGVHNIRVKAIDKAGWSSPETTASIDIDLTAPDLPVMDKCTYLDGMLQFNWHVVNKDHDLAQFNIKQKDGTVKAVTPTVDPDNPDLYHGSFSVNINGLGYNALVEIDVNSEDQAGNSSDYKYFTGHTLAKLGSLQFKDVTYDPVIGHQMHWQLTDNPGGSQVLEYGNKTASGFTALGSLTPDASGVITQDALADGSKLQPHATYYYRLVAYNNSGDPVYG